MTPPPALNRFYHSLPLTLGLSLIAPAAGCDGDGDGDGGIELVGVPPLRYTRFAENSTIQKETLTLEIAGQEIMKIGNDVLSKHHKTVIVPVEIGDTVEIELEDKSKKATALWVDKVRSSESDRPAEYRTKCTPEKDCSLKIGIAPLKALCTKPLAYVAFVAHSTRTSGEISGDPLVIIVPKDGACTKK